MVEDTLYHVHETKSPDSVLKLAAMEVNSCTQTYTFEAQSQQILQVYVYK